MGRIALRISKELPRILSALFGLSPDAVKIQESTAGGGRFQVIFRDKGLPLHFVIASTHAGAAAPVSLAIHDLLAAEDSRRSRGVIPLVVVPYMGEVARRLCEEAGIPWVDLSGNARIIISSRPPIRIIVQGKPNLFRSVGSTSKAFAPKASRIVRCLLMEPSRIATQRQLSRMTGVSEGFVSQIVHRLAADGLISRGSDAAVRVPDPDLLLEAWRETYRFEKHRVIKAHVLVRTSELLLQELSSRLHRAAWEYAFTGLAAAWLWAPFASYRLTTLYVRDPADPLVDENTLASLLQDLSFRVHPGAANLWVALPCDEGVFQGAGPAGQAGVRCVHPLQVYLDLKDQPERAPEAAEELRKRVLTWRSRD